MMTPFAFNRLNQRQRMLAGLNALGMAIPPTTGSVGSKGSYIAMPNQAVDVKQGGAVVGSTALQKANVLAPAGALKRAVTSTLTQSSTSSGIDARNTSAAQLLTASADQLNLRRNTVKSPPTYSKLPGSNITPTQPSVAPNPINNAYLDKQLAKAKRDLELQLAARSLREQEGRALTDAAAEKMRAANEAAAKEAAAAADQQKQQTPDKRSTGYDPSNFYDPNQGYRYDDTREKPALDLLDTPPALVGDKKPFPTGMVIAGVAVAGLVAYLFLK